VVYKGEKVCQGKYKTAPKKGQPCDKVAYYSQDGGYFCGVHSDKNLRVELDPNPNKADLEKTRNEDRENDVVEAMIENQSKNQKGTVTTTKLYGRKNPQHQKGFMSVFP